MVRIAALTLATAGLLVPAYLDKPENYAHDALLPITSAATTTTGAEVVGPPEAPQAAPTTTIALTTTTRLSSSVPATSIDVLSNAKCPEWWATAATWWPDDQLDTVDRIIWNESRCQADARSDTGDHGLMQINWATWSTFVTELGYTRDQLYVPDVNLLIGRLIAEEAERIGWCPFQPWYMSGSYGC